MNAEHLKNITKIGKYKKLNYKVSKNKHTTNEDKSNHTHSQIDTNNEHLKNMPEIGIKLMLKFNYSSS